MPSPISSTLTARASQSEVQPKTAECPRDSRKNLSDARPQAVLRRIRVWTIVFLIGLVLSGATAIPLQGELDLLTKWTGAERIAPDSSSAQNSALTVWLQRVRSALHETSTHIAFLYYGTDWLAFGHFVIAIAFIGAFRDPIRNSWLFTFGIAACILVIPYALIFGAVRGIPFWWRLIDCSFGAFGLFPLWLCRRWVGELEGHANSLKR